MKNVLFVLAAVFSSVTMAFPGGSLDSSVYVSDSSTNVPDSSTRISNGYNTSSYNQNRNYAYGGNTSNTPSYGSNYNRVGNNTYGTGYENRGYSSTRVSDTSSVVQDPNGNLHTCTHIGYTVTCN